MIVFNNNIKVSIIFPIFNSHQVVFRQCLYFYSLHLPNDVEIIFMDDGSDPPLKDSIRVPNIRNFNIYPTGDKRAWTQTAAKNLGVKIAEGEFVFITDIDHIITPEAIGAARNFDGDKMQFTREIGILNNRGRISQEKEDLFAYGWNGRGLKLHQHTNTFVMRRQVFKDIGGYPPHLAEQQVHNIYDDNYLYGRYRRHAKTGHCKPAVWGPRTLVFPNPQLGNPKLYFHDLDRSK